MSIQSPSGVAGVMSLLYQLQSTSAATSAGPSSDPDAAAPPAAAAVFSSASSGLSAETLSNIIQAAQMASPGTAGDGISSAELQPASGATPISDPDMTSFTFPPASAPQNVQDAWSQVTAGLSPDMKMNLTMAAMSAGGQFNIPASPSGGQSGPGDAAAAPDAQAGFDWSQFGAGVASSLQADQQYAASPQDLALNQTMIGYFQDFQAAL